MFPASQGMRQICKKVVPRSEPYRSGGDRPSKRFCWVRSHGHLRSCANDGTTTQISRGAMLVQARPSSHTLGETLHGPPFLRLSPPFGSMTPGDWSGWGAISSTGVEGLTSGWAASGGWLVFGHGSRHVGATVDTAREHA